MKRILLIVFGGVAYKALELVRLLRRDALHVTAVLTDGGAFATALGTL